MGDTRPDLLELLDEPIPTLDDLLLEVSGIAHDERRAEERAERAAFFSQAVSSRA